jgi:hypothetical protein
MVLATMKTSASICWKTRRLGCGLLLLWAALLSGCGGNTPKCIPVYGTVTLDGKKVPGPGYIYFNPNSAGEALSRPGRAAFDTNGNYRATTFVPADGLLPGTYVLRVECWKVEPNMEGRPAISFLPQKYQDAAKSGLTLTVEPNAKAIKFDISLASK